KQQWRYAPRLAAGRIGRGQAFVGRVADTDFDTAETRFAHQLEKVPAEVVKCINAASCHAIAVVLRWLEVFYLAVVAWAPAQYGIVPVREKRHGEQHDAVLAKDTRAFAQCLFRVVDMFEHVA